MLNGLQISYNDIMQIIILYLVVYGVIRLIKGTRSAQVLLGFCVTVVSLLLFTHIFKFDVLARVVYFLLVYLALSMVVVFQQDIRRMLALVGGQRLFSRQYALSKAPVTEILTRSIINMSSSRLGALVAIERGISLRGYEESGIMINALLSHELLVSIFTPPLPLHDGGIVIRDGRISAAHCLFPVSNRSELISSGMRHRAAVGLSEETDAVVFVVSEETGAISIAYNGKLHRYVSKENVNKVMLRWLRLAMPHQRKLQNVSFTDMASNWFAARVTAYTESQKKKKETGHAVKPG
ncbi:MAG: diadenylate cyclase CdaA [Kiritimatiellia bacterium]